MTGSYAACLHRNQSRSYLNHLVFLSRMHSQLDIKFILMLLISSFHRVLSVVLFLLGDSPGV